MGWFGKLTFGTMGMLFGGPLGAIAGAALGHILVDKNGSTEPRQISFGHSEQSQATYFVSIFSILGKLAKADGQVSQGEIAVVEEFLSSLNIPEQEKMFAKHVFNEAKASPYSIEDFAAQLYEVNRNQPTILLSFMDLLFKLAAADGSLHQAEEESLQRVKNVFRISDQQYNNIKAIYFKDESRYYKTLNCDTGSSDQEIRASYKRLVKEFHPDTVISKGLPEEFVEFATKRFQEIQEAYEHVKRERNFK